jgi:dTDP-4-amino-4,6-dideoxygalactose transaminase
VYHQYTIRLIDQDREKFAAELKRLGVDSDVYYPAPVHTLPAYGLSLDTPIAISVSKSCLSLPIHQDLSKANLHKIAEMVNKVASAGA